MEKKNAKTICFFRNRSIVRIYICTNKQSTVTVTGSSNTATISQSGADNTNILKQSNDNTFELVQDGDDNSSNLRQVAQVLNEAYVNQIGRNSLTHAGGALQGTNNLLNLDQVGNGNTADVY